MFFLWVGLGSKRVIHFVVLIFVFLVGCSCGLFSSSFCSVGEFFLQSFNL